MLLSASIALSVIVTPAEASRKQGARGPWIPACAGMTRWTAASPLLGLGDRLGDDLRIGAEPVRLLDELAAFDLEDLHPTAAFMVCRSDLERRNETTEAEVVDLLEALLDVLAGRLLAAIRLESVADGFDMDGGPEDATVVDHGVIHLLWRLLPLCFVHRLDFLADGIVVAGTGELQGMIAFRHRPSAGCQDIGLGRRPDETHHLGHRVAVALEFLDRDGRRPAEQVGDHEVRVETLRDVEHLCAHLDPRRRHGKCPELEFLLLLQILDDRQRLAASRVVVEDVGDLLAFEVAAQLVLDELDRPGALRPIGRSDRKEVRKSLTVRRGGDAETRRGTGNLVLGELLVQRLHLRRTVGHYRDRTIPLHALVGLDRLWNLVLVVELLGFDLVAFDPAVRIDQVVVVVARWAQHHTIDLSRPSAVAQLADDHLLLLCRSIAGEGETRCYTRGDSQPCGRQSAHR